jgi:superfamily I DNA/RNA helicase
MPVEADIPLYSTLTDLPPALSSRPRKCVTDFVELMNKLVASRESMPLVDFLQMLLEETGLLAQYEGHQ